MLNEKYLKIIDRCILQVNDSALEIPSWVSNYAQHHRYRLSRDLEMVSQWASPGSLILEVGSAPFFLTLALNQKGYKVTGIDIDPDRFSQAIDKLDLDVKKKNIEEGPLPFQDETFDIILLNEVFEHLRIDPIATMTEIRRVLKPHGILFLSTPNLRSLRGIWMLIIKQQGGHVGPDVFDEYKKIKLFGHMGHVREYTSKEVSTFLEKVGFGVKKTVFRSYDPVYRARLKAKFLQTVEKTICSFIPSLKPLFTIICEKGENNEARTS